MKGGMGSGTAAPDGPYSLRGGLVRRGRALLGGEGEREEIREWLSTFERCEGDRLGRLKYGEKREMMDK